MQLTQFARWQKGMCNLPCTSRSQKYDKSLLCLAVILFKVLHHLLDLDTVLLVRTDTFLFLLVHTSQKPSKQVFLLLFFNCDPNFRIDTALPVQLNDLHRFDPNTLEWIQILPADVLGFPPSARVSFGFGSANGNLFVYGGKSASGLF
jgi:hypothetical protein